MDIYYPKDNAVSHGKVHELLGPEALQKGEPLTEESIRWLLELHGEMYLIEQHYSTRTRTRRLALNGTPVAEFSDVEPMVDFQLGASNIRMRFSVRDNGIVYELFVNGKRFEDLTQALPSPIAARAEGSGMTFGARLMSQRLGLLPPHLQQPPPQQPQLAPVPSPHLSAEQQHQQLMAFTTLDSSLSSLTQPIPLDNALALLDDSLHGPASHQRRPSRRISLNLGGHHGGAHDPTDILASIAAASAAVAAASAASASAMHPIQAGSQALALTTQTHHHGFINTPETSAAVGTPTTIALSSASHAGSGAWADMVVMDGGASPSFIMMPPADAAKAPGRMREDREGTAMVIGATGGMVASSNVHGAGLLLRPSVEELYFSSDDEGEGEGERERDQAATTSVMVVAAPPGRAARRRRGTTSEFLIQDGEHANDAMMETAEGGPGRIVLPAFKVAKTSAAARPATRTGTGTGTGSIMHHGSLPNLLKAVAAQQQLQSDHQQHEQQVAAAPLKRRGLEHVLVEEVGGPRPPAIQRSFSASDVMGRPPKLSIQVPAPPTTLNCTGLLKRGLLKSGAPGAGAGGNGGNVGPRGIHPPVCLPR